MNNDNILIINDQILKKISDEIETEKQKHYKSLNILENLKKESEPSSFIIKEISDKSNNIKKRLEKLQNDLDFYTLETVELLNKYKDILKTPKKINFMGNIVNEEDNVKQNIISSYKNIASKYLYIKNDTKCNKTLCNSCDIYFENEKTEEEIQICPFCFTEYNTRNTSFSYNDNMRINVSFKYTYDRKSHFKDCINQYQGKQNVVIPESIYKKLDLKFKFHNLLIGDEKTPRLERYSKITKKTVLTFLKELGLSKHYENINLIYSTISGKKLNDITHILDDILKDFDILLEHYDKKFSNINRKNFINTQYVLYQLLLKHNYPCEKEDFANIKTLDRKFFHETIMKTLFEDLGWNYISIF